MELALIRTLMDKEFYDNHKGIRCPDKIFTKDVRKIKQTLDYAMNTYEKTLSPSELVLPVPPGQPPRVPHRRLLREHDSTVEQALSLKIRAPRSPGL